jgi:hypothetical protein
LNTYHEEEEDLMRDVLWEAFATLTIASAVIAIVLALAVAVIALGDSAACVHGDSRAPHPRDPE